MEQHALQLLELEPLLKMKLPVESLANGVSLVAIPITDDQPSTPDRLDEAR